MFVWQETYDPDLYAEFIAAGPKAHGITDLWGLGEKGQGYAFRLHSQSRAMRAGLDVGLGFMLGLNPDINFEFLMALHHARVLIEEAGPAHNPIILGMPTWNSITTPRTDLRPATTLDCEDVFPFVAAVLFLSLPKGGAWVFPNCRVSIDSQVRAVDVAGAFTSTEVKLGPGGYLPAMIRQAEAAGRDMSAMRAKMLADLEMGGRRLEEVERLLDHGEQFTHHYHPHADYVEAFRRSNLEIVPLSELARASSAG
jgi:hypothetical protein